MDMTKKLHFCQPRWWYGYFVVLLANICHFSSMNEICDRNADGYFTRGLLYGYHGVRKAGSFQVLIQLHQHLEMTADPI